MSEHGAAARARPRWLMADVDGSAPCLVRGEGVHVWDSDGRRYLDAASGVGVVAFGYGDTRIVDAMTAQAKKLPYAHALRFRNEPAEVLAGRLCALAPDPLEHAFFASGGSEAMESALKLAIQYHRERGEPGRTKLIGRTQSFHGNTLGTLSVGFHHGRRERHEAVLLDFPHVSAPFCYHCPLHLEPTSCALACARELEDVLLAEGPETVAAFVAEPVSGAAGGAFVPPPGYLPLVADICARHGVLLIADEVITGLGRTGADFAVEHWNVVPDLMVVAKALSGGYAPLGAVLATDEVVDAFRAASGRFEHNFTFAGHAVACAAGVAALEIFAERELSERARVLGDRLLRECRSLGEGRPHVGDVRGLGLLLGIELVDDRKTRSPLPAGMGSAILNRCALDAGLIVYPCTGTYDGRVGDHILLMPPLVIDDGELDVLLERLDTALATFEVQVHQLRGSP